LNYQLDLEQYNLLYSNIKDEDIKKRIKSSEVIDYAIYKLGLSEAPIVTFSLTDDEKAYLKEFFYDEMMNGYPHNDNEEQTEESKLYEGLMYLIIQL
jgi:hypothetical protein